MRGGRGENRTWRLCWCQNALRWDLQIHCDL